MHIDTSSSDRAGDLPFSAAILFGWVLGWLPIESGPVWIPEIVHTYGTSGVTAGMIASGQMLLAAVVALVVVPRLTGVSLRALLLFGSAMICVAGLMTAFASPSLTTFTLLRIADGIGSGTSVAAAGILASRTLVPPRTFGLLQLGQVLGSMIIYSLTAYVLPMFGIGSTYVIVTPIAILTLGLLVASKGWPRLAYAAGPASNSARAGWNWRLFVSCLGIGLLFCVLVGVTTNVGNYVQRAAHELSQASVMLAIATPFSAVAAIAATLMAGRVSSRAVLVIAAVGGALSYIGFGMARDLKLMQVALCLGSVFIMLCIPTILAAVSRLNKTAQAASAAQAATFAGLALGPIVGAVIVQAFSLDGLTVFAALAIPTAAALASVATTATPPDTTSPDSAVRFDAPPASGVTAHD